MADTPDDALIEALAEAILAEQYPETSKARVIRVLERDRAAARAAYAALVEHLGLTEETRYVEPIQPHPEPTPLERRFVSKWVEVQP